MDHSHTFDNVISSVAFPAYSATKGSITYRLSDDIHLKFIEGARVSNFGKRIMKEELWLVQGVFSTDSEIEESVLNSCDVVRPVLISSDLENSCFTYQMQPIISN